MKRHFLFAILLAACAVSITTAQPVNFPDANLKAAVEEALGKANPTQADMLGLTFIDIGNKGIASLAGLEFAANLKTLRAWNNSIQDISALSNLRELEYVAFNGNQVSDISALSGMTKLEELWMQDCLVSDISPLSGLTRLIKLGAWANAIEDISSLSHLQELIFLNLDRNQVADVYPLRNLTKLEQLGLSNNQIHDISALSGLTSLMSLSLNGNQISDISSLSGMTNLEELWMVDCLVSDVSPLAGLTKLIKCGAWNNNIWDVSALGNLHELIFLQLDMNQITDVYPLRNLTKLEELGLYSNQISDIGALSGLIELKNLSLRENRVGSIDSLASMTKMEHLSLVGCGISDISPLSNMTKLNWLHLWSNKVADVEPLRNLINLRWLSLGYNHNIRDVEPLSGLVNLSDHLNISYNQIEDISSLANLTKLTSFHIAYNNISDISILSNFHDLQELLMQKNQIADIGSLAGVTSLERLELQSNQITDLEALLAFRNLKTLKLNYNPLGLSAYTDQIPQIKANNPGIELEYEELVWQTLSIGSSIGGSVAIPGEGDLGFVQNEIVTVQAVPDDKYTAFVKWIGSAVENGSVLDPEAAFTQMTVMGDGDLYALFKTRDTSIEFDRELEIRGRLYCDDPDDPLCLPGAHQLDVSPDSSEVFVLERLELQSGVTLSLADHFHDHPGNPFDVLYVKDLVLAEGAELNLAGQRLYYETLSGQSGQIVNRKIYKSQLSSATFGDPITLDNDVTTNNTPEQIFVELVDDVNIAPEPVIHLQNQASEAAHAKIRLGRFSEDEVIVSFSYLFSSNQPGVVLEAYLSDQHGLLPLDDPHMLLAGRIVPPILGCPGSLGSGLFASYTLPVDVTLLDPNQGLWLELILSEPALTMQGFSTMAVVMPAGDPSQGGAYIYDPALSSMCLNICMDLTGDGFVSAEDYTLVSAGCGRALDMSTPNTSPLSCIDRGYSQDRYVDASDLVNWGDLIARSGSTDILNLCSMPMVWEDAVYQVGTAFMSYGVTVSMAAPEAMIYSDLLFLGKGSTFIGNQEFVGYKDMLQGFDSDGASSQAYTLSSNQGQMRLVQGERDVYILDGDKGLCQLNGDVVVGPSQQIFQGKKVTLGIQNNAAQALRGRPLRDASFHNGFAYVVPVIVQEPDGVVYQAGAKLKLIGQDYEIRQLYYDPDLASVSGQSPNLRGLREIEVDSAGRVYLLNAYNQNGSNLLWAFDNAGALLSRHFLDRLSESIKNPVGLCYDTHSERLYVASGVFDKTLPNQSILYGYERPAVLSQDALVPIQKIIINDLQHITSISSDQQGTLWATGFTLTNTPEILDASVLSDPLDRPLPGPRLTQVDTSGEGTSELDAISLFGTMEINIPTSVVYVSASSEPVPVALWKFDELGGTTANDDGGNNHGTIQGATSIEGILNGALQFDGINDYVDCGNSPDLVPGAMTMSLWVYPDVLKGFLINKSGTGASNKDYELSLSRYGIKVAIGGEGQVENLHYTSSLPVQQWFHVAFSYGEGMLSLYINGVLSGSTTYDFSVTDKGHPLSVGGGNTSDRFKGRIDNVGIYDVVLSEDEILGLFEEGQ